MKPHPLHSSSSSSSCLCAILCSVFLVCWVQGYTDPAACTGSSQFYHTVTLQCSSCPTNTAQATDFTYCNCSNSHYHSPDVIGFNDPSSCVSLTTPSSYNKTSQIVSTFSPDGSSSVGVISCLSSYPDSSNSRCIPCGPLTTYDSTLGCVCSTTNDFYVMGACYTNTNVSWIPQNSISANPVDYLVEVNAVIGCGQQNIIQACNQLVNKCIQNGYSSSDFFCQLLATFELSKTPANGLPLYSFSALVTSSISIDASSIVGTNTSTVKNTLRLVLAEYTLGGELRDIKSLDGSIFGCYLNNQDLVNFQSFGLQFSKQCSSVRTFSSSYFYDVYVVEGSGSYSEVPVLIGGSYYKRFTPSAYNSLELTLTNGPPLQVPSIALTNQSPAVVTTTSQAQSTSITYMIFLVFFMIGMLICFGLDFFRYLRYNPDENNDPYYCCKVIFLFLIHIVRFVAVGIWFWMLALSAFCFCFYKFQQTVYLMLPSPANDTTGLYSSFEAFFYITFSFTIVAILIVFFRVVNSTDYFLIDWEKEKELGKFDVGRDRREISVWRKVLVVNQLYELSMSRVINIELVSLLALLLLSGLNWMKLDGNIPSTSPLLTDLTLEHNPILAYFIITLVIFSIALLQFILRHAVKTWMPLPAEEFVDLCSVCNVSIFIFDETLHGYYIHGMNPMGQSQGSLQYIHNMFEKEAKAFGKSRSFKLEDADQCQTFEVVFPMEVRQAFQVKYVSRFNEKLVGKGYATSVLSNPIPENLNDEDYNSLDEITRSMLETFKYYLEGIKTSSQNIIERTLLEKVVDCPLDPQTIGKLPVFLKDGWLQFKTVMVGGHQFLLLMNFINFVNVFYLATKNIFFSLLLALIFERMFTFLIGFFIKRNISKNTLIDDKFFN